VFLTRIGSHGLVWALIAIVLTVVQRSRTPLLLTGLAVLAADGLASLVKVAVGSKRPGEPDALIEIPHSHSFPSGHTATAFAAATVLSFCTPRLAPALFLLAAAIAYSRLYVGVHFPLDVAGGIVIGVATALLLRAAIRRRSLRAPRPG
jgi:undecaprenyl-diphosphatase